MLVNDVAIEMKSSCLYKLLEQLNAYDNIYIYGAGMVGKFIYNYLKDNKMTDKMASFLVTEPAAGGGV